MRNIKQFINWFHPKFHIFTVACAVSFLAWQLYNAEPLQPTIARAVETIAPNLIEFLTGGNALAPTDFVLNHKN